MRRTRGTGSITKQKNGGFWARLPVDGVQTSFGVHPSYELAEDVLDRALIKRASTPGAGTTVQTFASFGRKVLDMREDEGVRGIKAERRTFKRHLEQCFLADRPIREITSADISDVLRSLTKKQAADERGARKIERETVSRIRTLMSAIFKASVERGLRDSNPCRGVAIKGVKKSAETDPDEDEKWDWLRGDEQQALLACEDVPRWFRVMCRVAWGTGLRQGEMWNLELKDVHLPLERGCSCGASKCLRLRERGPHVHVRYGSRGHLPPKNGKVRVTPLFGEGLAGLVEWLRILPHYSKANPFRLAFPSVTGCRRQVGAPERSSKRDAHGKQHKIDLLHEALEKIGVMRSVRWHDLRHTCASSLVSGTWGQRWELLHVRDMLGHRDIKTTQRYAHLDENTLHEAGASTPGHVTAHVTSVPTVPTQVPVNVLKKCEGGDLNPYASYGRIDMESDHEVREVSNISVAQRTIDEITRLLGAGATPEQILSALQELTHKK